jgi:transcriptional regulator with XRE-family HTH domain
VSELTVTAEGALLRVSVGFSAEVTFGEFLRLAMAARGLSQHALAVRVGITDSYMSLLAHGKREPSMALVRQFAKALEVPPWSMALVLANGPEERAALARLQENLETGV